MLQQTRVEKDREFDQCLIYYPQSILELNDRQKSSSIPCGAIDVVFIQADFSQSVHDHLNGFSAN